MNVELVDHKRMVHDYGYDSSIGKEVSHQRHTRKGGV